MLHVSLLHLVPALAPFVSASEEKAFAPGGEARSTEREVPALFSWGDFDGDGRLDLAAVQGDGILRLLSCVGDGRFEDVTDRSALSGVGEAAMALWADFDADGRLDLFVGARTGASRLFHNEGGTFLDITASSGLECEGAVQSAYWLDHDVDGWLDLFVVTKEKSTLFHGLEGGFFQATDLSATTESPGEPNVVVSLPAPFDTNPTGGASAPARDDVERPSASHTVPDRGVGAFVPLGPAPTVGSVTPLMGFPGGCANSVRDQANPSACLAASTTPTLGMLYPISANLFVAAGGNVGIGTTGPTARLEVAGTARITDTLTLAPAGDQALNVSTGSIYKGGALFIHTKGGPGNTALGPGALANASYSYNNTAVGYRALYYNTSGTNNTASGYAALHYNTTGAGNTGIGERALRNNTTGNANTGTGFRALFSNTTGGGNTGTGWGSLNSNTTGSSNTANGHLALRFNTTGYSNTACGEGAIGSNTTGKENTACGSGALFFNTAGNDNTAIGFQALLNTTGTRNIGLGRRAGSTQTTGNDNIAIGNIGVAGEGATIRVGTAGTQTRAFVAGIRGVTTGVADAIPVVVDSAGQLGTVSSSRRFKKDIADMGEATEKLLDLRPVVFRYDQEQVLPNGGEVPLEYGLIAEEVAEVFPDLVVYDDEGKPFTVKYHLLSSMLLNELKEQARELEDMRARLTAVEERVR